jgi:hypothetical protein
MIIYQMEATGPLYLLNGEHSIMSRKVYTTMPNAIEIQEFKQKCGPEGGGVRDLDPTKITIKIVKLDLIDNS